jgi:hypothetical protein
MRTSEYGVRSSRPSAGSAAAHTAVATIPALAPPTARSCQGPDAIVNVHVEVNVSGLPVPIFWFAGIVCEKVSVTVAGPVPVPAEAL